MSGHYRPVWPRFWSRVVQGPSGCLLWTGATNSEGYGQLSVLGKVVYVHRLNYERVNGPLPEGWEPDHLCRTRACVNTDHMEGVPKAVNIARGDAPSAVLSRANRCSRGHDLSDAYRTKQGRRQCRPCRQVRRREARARG